MPTWKEKLHPERFKGMSGMMAAIVGYISDEDVSGAGDQRIGRHQRRLRSDRARRRGRSQQLHGRRIRSAAELEQPSRRCWRDA